jgi:CheY-like chemotaxis protein
MERETKKLLVVDDDKFLREMYVTKFSGNGFQVRGASSGPEALDIMKSGFTPDAVLFDLIMPSMDGWEFLTEVKNSKLVPNAKMIVLSNQGSAEDVEESENYRVDGYIVKALKAPSEVVEEVQKICN